MPLIDGKGLNSYSDKNRHIDSTSEPSIGEKAAEICAELSKVTFGIGSPKEQKNLAQLGHAIFQILPPQIRTEVLKDVPDFHYFYGAPESIALKENQAFVAEFEAEFSNLLFVRKARRRKMRLSIV